MQYEQAQSCSDVQGAADSALRSELGRSEFAKPVVASREFAWRELSEFSAMRGNPKLPQRTSSA
jgi:hypothetical protein